MTTPGDGFHVHVNALKDVGLGLADLLAALDAFKVVEDIDRRRTFLGHTGLADSYVILSLLITRGGDLERYAKGSVLDAAAGGSAPAISRGDSYLDAMDGRGFVCRIWGNRTGSGGVSTLGRMRDRWSATGLGRQL